VRRTVSQREESLDRLLEQAGFVCEFRSRDEPPITRYVAGVGHPDEMEIEFITPMRRNEETAISVQSDLTAQALRHVEILLEHTWAVQLDELTGGELLGEVRLPKPAAYVFHRSLTYRRRLERVKAEKDLYYAFHVLAAFPEWHPWIRTDLPALAAEWPAWFQHGHADMTKQFGSIESPGIAAVAHQRPATAYPGLNDEQFKQYVLGTMQIWLEMVEAAGSSSGT